MTKKRKIKERQRIKTRKTRRENQRKKKRLTNLALRQARRDRLSVAAKASALFQSRSKKSNPHLSSSCSQLLRRKITFRKGVSKKPRGIKKCCKRRVTSSKPLNFKLSSLRPRTRSNFRSSQSKADLSTGCTRRTRTPSNA